ncbi:MAG: hypothetical protein AAFN08_04580 [Cyanobacteria bacterium J06559_3]
MTERHRCDETLVQAHKSSGLRGLLECMEFRLAQHLNSYSKRNDSFWVAYRVYLYPEVFGDGSLKIFLVNYIEGKFKQVMPMLNVSDSGNGYRFITANLST